MIRLGVHLVSAAKQAALQLDKATLRSIMFSHGSANFVVSLDGPETNDDRYLGQIDAEPSFYLFARPASRVTH